MTTTPRTALRRLVLALLIGCASALLVWLRWRAPHEGGPDFTVWWTAARELLRGDNPFVELPRELGPASLLYYPLPAVLATYPFALLPLDVALPAFTGVSASLLAWAVLATNAERWPLFLSFSFVHAAVMGQWEMLLTAGLLLPVLGFVAALKPNIGAAMVFSSLSWRMVLAIALVLLLSLLAMPSWPRQWWDVVRSSPLHFSMWRVPGGIFTLLALLRWRRPEARLVAALGAVPMSPFAYEALPLFVVPRTRWEAYTLVALSDLTLMVYAWARHLPLPEEFRFNGMAVAYCLYIPATIMVLRRANEGSVPPGLERLARRLPRWLRGSAIPGQLPGSLS